MLTPFFVNYELRFLFWVIVRFVIVGFLFFGGMSAVSAQSAPDFEWDISSTFTSPTGFGSNFTQIATSTLYGAGHSLQVPINNHKSISFTDSNSSLHEGASGLFQHTYITGDMANKNGEVYYKIQSGSPYEVDDEIYVISENNIKFHANDTYYTVATLSADTVHTLGFYYSISPTYTATSTTNGFILYEYPVEVTFIVDGYAVHSTTTVDYYIEGYTSPIVYIYSMNFGYQTEPRILFEVNNVSFWGASELGNTEFVCEGCSQITHLEPTDQPYIVFLGGDIDLTYEYQVGSRDIQDGAEYWIEIDSSSMSTSTVADPECNNYSEKIGFWDTLFSGGLYDPLVLYEPQCLYSFQKTYQQGQVWPTLSPTEEWLTITSDDMPSVGDYIVTYRLKKRALTNTPAWYEFWSNEEYTVTTIALDGYNFAYQRRLTHDELIQLADDIENKRAINEAQMLADKACDISTFSARECMKEITDTILKVAPFGYITRFVEIINNPTTGDGADTDFENFTLTLPAGSPLANTNMSLNLVSPNTFMQSQLSGTVSIFGVTRTYYDHFFFFWELMWRLIFMFWLISTLIGITVSGTTIGRDIGNKFQSDKRQAQFEQRKEASSRFYSSLLRRMDKK